MGSEREREVHRVLQAAHLLGAAFPFSDDTLVVPTIEEMSHDPPLLPLRYRLIVLAILFLVALWSIRVIDGHVMQRTAERRGTPSPTENPRTGVRGL